MSTYSAVLGGLKSIYSMLVSSNRDSFVFSNDKVNKEEYKYISGSSVDNVSEQREKEYRETGREINIKSEYFLRVRNKKKRVYEVLEKIAEELGDRYLISIIRLYPLHYVAEETLLSKNYKEIVDKLFDKINYSEEVKQHIQEIYSELRRSKGMREVWYYILKAIDEARYKEDVVSFIRVLDNPEVMRVIEIYQGIEGFDTIMLYIYYVGSEIHNHQSKEKVIKDISLLADPGMIEVIKRYKNSTDIENIIEELVKIAYNTRDIKKIKSLAKKWDNKLAA